MELALWEFKKKWCQRTVIIYKKKYIALSKRYILKKKNYNNLGRRRLYIVLLIMICEHLVLNFFLLLLAISKFETLQTQKYKVFDQFWRFYF